jgi:acetyl esterase
MTNIILLLAMPVILASASQFSIPVYDEDTVACRKEKYATAEPGTCLDPRAYRLLKAVDRIHENPYNNDFAKRLIDIIEPGVKKVVDTNVPNGASDVPVRIYYPSRKCLQNPTPAIFFIHGGGFMFGSIEEYDMAVKKLARITDMIVVAADYRLAPEYPYPAALEDVDAVVKWIISNRKALGIAGDRITLMGDSAGANLATVLALKYRDEQKDHILAQVLYYPPTTFMEREFPSRLYFLLDEDRTYFLTEEFVRLSKEHYLPDSIPDDDPYVSPLEADLSGDLPPVLLITAQVDPLRDDGRMYAEKLKAAGQDVTYTEYEGMIHGFMNFYMIFPEAKESMRKTRDFLTSLVTQPAELPVTATRE